MVQDAPLHQGVQPKSVVVIDDELDEVDMMVLLLQSAGHRRGRIHGRFAGCVPGC